MVGGGWFLKKHQTPSTHDHPPDYGCPPPVPKNTVLVLESRRAQELASLVTTYGGDPLVAPSMREVPLESNTEAVACAEALERGECDLLILLTGVGTRTLG